MVTLEGLLRCGGLPRLIRLQLNGLSKRVLPFSKIFDVACANGLHHRIAQGGRLDRACNYFARTGIRGHLAEEAVEAAATDDANDAESAASDALQIFQSFAIGKTQALKNAAGKFALGLRYFANPEGIVVVEWVERWLRKIARWRRTYRLEIEMRWLMDR